MAAITICGDFEAPPAKKVWHCFHCFPIYLPWRDGTRCHDLSFWMLSFQPAFSLSSFTFIKRLFSSSLLSAIRVMRIHWSRFSSFPICFRCQMTIEWLTLSSSATSCVVVGGSSSMSVSVGDCRLPAVGHFALRLQGSLLLCKLLEALLHCAFGSSSWTKCIVDVASCLHCFMTHFELE